MGIITKEVEVKLGVRNLKYYENLGYNIPVKEASKSHKKRYHKDYVYDLSKSIMVKVEDLQPGSKTFVRVRCDICQKNEMDVRFYDYNKAVKNTGNYVCQECSVKKQQNTTMNKYGVAWVLQADEVKEKIKITNLQKYGVDNYSKTPEYSQKVKNTCIAKYGYENPLQSSVVQDKRKETIFQKYGVENVSQSPTTIEKRKQTFLTRYGVEYISQSKEIKEKIRNTNLEKYGCEHCLQSPKVREKIANTLYCNGTNPTSLQQHFLHNLYGGELNFPIKHYSVDICFPKEKLYIEYDGGGHRLEVLVGSITDEQFDRKELIRNNIIKGEGYKQMRIISTTDKLPPDEILLQMLEHTRKYFSDYPNHSWIEFNVDSSIVRNAEQKEGSYFNFGELRRIKKSDVETINSSESNCA